MFQMRSNFSLILVEAKNIDCTTESVLGSVFELGLEGSGGGAGAAGGAGRRPTGVGCAVARASAGAG